MSTSRPIELLNTTWSGANKATSHSWERLNHAMYTALTLAIGSGMEFAEGDWEYIASHYNSDRWIGESSENFYTLAIEVGNLSFAASYEFALKRDFIIADNVRQRERSPASMYLHGGLGTHQRCRLAVGFCFPWDGHDVKVTSFSKEGEQTCVFACAHEDGSKHWGKIIKRYRITRADIIAGRKAARPHRGPSQHQGETVDAWHFRNSEGKTIHLLKAEKVGKVYEVCGRIQVCSRGLHGSIRAVDALAHAGSLCDIVCRTRHSGAIDRRSDKLASQYREVLWQADCTEALRKFWAACPTGTDNALFESLLMELAPEEPEEQR